MLSMDSPWIKLAAPDTNREYFALLSYFPLNKYRAIPAFLKFTFQIQRQLGATPGILGYSLRANPFSRHFWTLSTCANQQVFQDFLVNLPHGQAIKTITPHLG